MSSFDFTDNFSGFNDLFNRAEFLKEAKRSPYEKYHPSFGPLTKELRSAGFSSAPLDTINFIRTTLYDLELINDDELAAAKKGAGFSAKKNNLLTLLDAKADVIEGNKDEIAAAIKDGLAQYINRATTNRGREEKYAAQKAALELAKDIKAGGDVGDAVEDTVGQLDDAEQELAQSLEISKEDPTTFIEIKIRDIDRVEDVGNIVSKYANEDGLDISGDTVQFSVDPNTPLANAVTAHGIDKIEAALKRDVDKISDSVVVVMAPDEDYEEMGYGFDSPEEPNEYSMGEEGGGITEVEDEEYDGLELDHFLTKEQPEDYIPSTDYEDVLDSLVKKDKEEHAKRLAGENEEDAIVMQPMLESHKTNTSAYLTEQSVADKRNKKSEVKPQSFKERYKPKTHWQLEELRRYGL